MYTEKKVIWLMVSLHGPLRPQYLMYEAVETYNGSQEVKRGKGVGIDTPDSWMMDLLSAWPYPLFHPPLSNTTGS